MNLLTQNTKLKRTSKQLGLRVFNFGIPAYKSASGKLTCPFADECIKFCYARKGAYTWSNVQPAFEKRYQITKQHDFVDIMSVEIAKKKPDYVRVHDSGDYYSKAYLMKWLEIAAIHTHIKFYSYTNCVDMLKNVELPDNYDKEFELDYDGRVQLSTLDFTNAQELIEAVVEKVHSLFVEKQEDND